MWIAWFILPLLSAAVAWAAARAIARHGAALGLVEIPNERSSHVRPTPRGGGAGVVLAGALAGGALLGAGAGGGFWFVLAVALAFAALGLWDDLRGLPVGLRLVAQFAGIAMLLAASPAPVTLPAFAILLVGGVWWVNLFNFMDGIDGLAATQALTMLLGAAGLAAWLHPDVVGNPEWVWMLAVAGAVAGFLALNWPPARIFMGDVGSLFLGFVLFGCAWVSVGQGWMSWPAWLILGAAFIADATVTLLRRVQRGDRWMQPHRLHGYQRLARRWRSHRAVTLLFAGINLGILLPLAACALRYPAWGWGLACLAGLSLGAAARMGGAGDAEETSRVGGE